VTSCVTALDRGQHHSITRAIAVHLRATHHYLSPATAVRARATAVTSRETARSRPGKTQRPEEDGA
jgi:hypothetical protein